VEVEIKTLEQGVFKVVTLNHSKVVNWLFSDSKDDTVVGEEDQVGGYSVCRVIVSC